MVQLFEVLSPLPEEFRLPLIHAFEIMREEAAQAATKADVLELRDAIRELAQAQRRTDERVAELAGAQRRTDQHVDQLALRMAELAEAQKRTEARVEELAEAQRRTDESLNQLALRMAELADAQTRTEERLERLITSHDRLCDQVGALSHTVGYRLEDEACLALPALLSRDKGIQLSVPLDRRFFQLPSGRQIEINIWGEARQNGSDVVVLGEAKSQLWRRDVDRFVETCVRFAQEFSPKPQIRVMVTYYLTPDVGAHAEANGILVYRSLDLARLREA